jgi:GT2 family glycosyltransferase
VGSRGVREEPLLVSVLVATRNRLEPLIEAVESVAAQDYTRWELLVLDDASEEPIEHQLGERFKELTVHHLRNEQRLGVAGSRNRLARESQGDVLVTLDDDAIFGDAGTLRRIAGHFAAMPEMAALAFRIVLQAEEQSSLQLPFTRRALRRDPALADRQSLVSYYVGAGHAHRRSAFEEVGAYQQDLIFYGEEVDWSYSAIAYGCRLMYAPDVVVVHRPRPSVVSTTQGGSRRDLGQETYFMVRNRLWIAYKHLPWHYFWAYVPIWMGYYFQLALRRGQTWSLVKGFAVGLCGLRRVSRRPLNAEAVRYLKAHHGRLWY